MSTGVASMSVNLNYEILSNFSGHQSVSSIPKLYVRFTGCHSKAAVLNQIIFYSNKSKLNNGWFYKSYEEWEEDICICERTMRRIIKNFESDGIVLLKTNKANGKRVLHIKIDIPKFMMLLEQFLSKSNQSEFAKELTQPDKMTDVEFLPQPDKMAVCNRTKWPDSQPDKMAVSIYTDKTTDKTTDTTTGEPVVVVVLNSEKITTLLRTAFSDNPVETPNIKTEKDFLSACEYSVIHRNDGNLKDPISEMQRVRGIIKLVQNNSFDDPPGWYKQKPTNKKEVDKRIQLQEEASQRKWQEEEKIREVERKRQLNIPITIDLVKQKSTKRLGDILAGLPMLQ